MFGRVDDNDPPGILREKGFGVEFPNYIVDVKKDPETGKHYFSYARIWWASKQIADGY